jgi:hypothetical protein
VDLDSERAGRGPLSWPLFRVQPELPIEDLEVYERHGGHTLRRHVDPRPSSDLRRLDRDPDINGAGTFLDRPTAQWAVEMTLRSHEAEIRAWLRRGAPGTLVAGAWFTRPVGSELSHTAWQRGETTPAPAGGARVVLRACDSLAGGFYVVTAYPVLGPGVADAGPVTGPPAPAPRARSEHAHAAAWWAPTGADR